jgi:hypothetical protein
VLGLLLQGWGVSARVRVWFLDDAWDPHPPQAVTSPPLDVVGVTAQVGRHVRAALLPGWGDTHTDEVWDPQPPQGVTSPPCVVGVTT